MLQRSTQFGKSLRTKLGNVSKMTIKVLFPLFSDVYTVVQNFRSGINSFHYAGMSVLYLLYHFHLTRWNDHSLI
jgi:hypothetical protein